MKPKFVKPAIHERKRSLIERNKEAQAKAAQRFDLLKNIDATVQTNRKLLELFEKRNPEKARKFFNGTKEAMGKLLNFFMQEGAAFGFNELQMKSLRVFFTKVENAKTAKELREAFEYFNQCSCILKLSNPFEKK